MPDLKIAAAYIRVSTDDQTEYSPESQRKLILDYAKREGYLVPEEHVYSDDGISGKSAGKRPGFRLMIAAAKADPPPFECIFVWKFSRFARNQEEAILYKNLLRRRGIAVRSISEPSSDSPFSGLIERIIEWMDEYYLINLADEVRRGMREKAVRGEAMGTAPFGYTVKNKTFVPNEHAETVRYIFRRYAAGAGLRALAVELGERGVRTRRGNLPDNRWIRYILGNPTYIGKIRWSSEGHANYSRGNYNGAHVMLADGLHPPIVDMDLWEAVQRRLQERQTETPYKRKGSRVFMLKGLIRCGSCGATLTLTSTAAPGLQCHKYAKGLCSVSHHIMLDKANAAVISALEELARSRSFVFTPQSVPSAGPARDWPALIASEEKKLARARDAFLDGVFSAEEYRSIRADTEDNISRLRSAQQEELSRLPAPPDPELFCSRVLSVLNAIRSPDVSEEVKNEFLRSILDKIIFHRSTGTFDFYFHP